MCLSSIPSHTTRLSFQGNQLRPIDEPSPDLYIQERVKETVQSSVHNLEKEISTLV